MAARILIFFPITSAMLIGEQRPTSRKLDSVNGTCSPGEFRCATGAKCLPNRWTCDGERDCADGSDESEAVCSRRQCGPEEWRCKASGGHCLPLAWLCDGHADCDDGSDESVCSKTCTGEEFSCSNGHCIQPSWRCDGEDDCGDRSDEAGCLASRKCDQTELTCSDGKCVNKRFLCDGDADCSHGEDEANCKEKPANLTQTCSSQEFRCLDFHFCVGTKWVCDGESDCPDGSDERPELCGEREPCRSNQFRCGSGECLPGDRQCNGDRDCRDGSDELQCGTIVVTGCDPLAEFDCGGGKLCVPMNRTCDGHNDCGGWQDEPKTCGRDECKDNNGGCHQICVDSPTSYRCECEPGYSMDKNSICQDVDECGEVGSCSQLCYNTIGSFKCDCIDGYKKDPHSPSSCRAAEGHLSLIFAHKADIRKVSLDRQAMTTIVNQTRSSCALDYVFKTGMVFWSDVMEEKIFSAPIDEGWRREVVVANPMLTADGLAADWIHGHLYWTDTATNTISVADFKGRMRTVLIKDDLEEPRAIALHPGKGWMFWSDWGSVARIERAGMDGSHRAVILQKTLSWPNGLTIDLVLDQLYWVDAKLNTIGCANLDGSGSRTVLFSTQVLEHPFSIAVFEDLVYWTDWHTHAIYQANKFNGSNVTPLTGTGLKQMPMTVQMYHPQRQPEFPNHCLPYNGECTHFCLPAPRITENSAKTSCGCPTGLRLDSDLKTCVVAEEVEPQLTSPLPGDKTALVAPEAGWSQVSGMLIGCSAAALLILALVTVYMYRRRHGKRMAAINFDNPVYRRGGGDAEQSFDRIYAAREADYIDIAISESQMMPALEKVNL